MRFERSNLGFALAICAVCVVAGAAFFTRLKHWREVDPTPDEQKIARTLQIIRSSSGDHPQVLKVLLYGQSITHSGWDKAVIEHWHERYPNTVFVVQNRALGGFAAESLLRTTQEDITAFYPDLIVFHVYGDHRSYEKILRLIRSMTAADVILQTDHGEVLPDPPCVEGLQISLHPQPGCAGVLWVHQREWHDEMSYHKLPAFAKKYGLALEPQRGWWRDYLLSTHTPPQALLVDQIHPNAKGKELIASFFDRYFDGLVDGWSGETEGNVMTVPVPASTRNDGKATVDFQGNRLELITTRPLEVKPVVIVDGHQPKDTDGCYVVTRASSVPNVPDWPTVRRIELHGDHTTEEWTATLTDFSADQSAFKFTVRGSVTGVDGGGDSAHDFTSNSGRITISAQDWMPGRAFDLKHVPLEAPFVAQWTVENMCDGPPETIDLGNGRKQYRYVLATGLTGGQHIVQISELPGHITDVAEFRYYKPELQP